MAKRILVIAVALTFFSCIRSQKLAAERLVVNKFSSESEVYGGMEDGGISRNETYIFVAKRQVYFNDLQLNNEPFRLNRGDSLIVNVSSYKAYSNGPNPNAGLSLSKKNIELRHLNNKYYWNINAMHWESKICYQYRQKLFCTPAKGHFDKSHKAYAP